MDSADAIAPTAQSIACLRHRASGQAAGVQWSGYGRLLYFTVSFEVFVSGDRGRLMEAWLAWWMERPRSRWQELVVGLGRGTQGKFAVMDASRDRGVWWGGLLWARYKELNGETRVSCGDADGDGDLEIAIGMGRHPQYGGWLELVGGLESNFQHVRWLRVPWTLYNSTEGSTRPAFGQVH